MANKQNGFTLFLSRTAVLGDTGCYSTGNTSGPLCVARMIRCFHSTSTVESFMMPVKRPR